MFILLYPSIITGVKEMEGRKCGYRNALFCFSVKQEHKSKLRIYHKKLKKVRSVIREDTAVDIILCNPSEVPRKSKRDVKVSRYE